MIRMTASLAGMVLLAVSVVAPGDENAGPVQPLEADPAAAQLGKRLFFDPRLSGDARLACASCHKPESAFSDNIALSDAYPGSLHFRNTPSLVNTALREAWMHDGRLGTNLNDVTREMLTETYLMNMDMRLMQERIKQDPVYVQMFEAAGYGEPSNGGVRKAIPEYLKTLTSRGAPFDTDSMSAEARRGFDLFKGKAGCAQCHSGPRFTDDRPHVTGTPDNPDIWADPNRHITFVTYAKFMGIENYMNLRHDPGAFIRTHVRETDASFLTPGLRELARTAPYMHNGIFETLEEVIEFYNGGGGERANKSPLLRPLGLSEEDQGDLLAFLLALTGDPLDTSDFVWSEPIPSGFDAISNWREVRN